MKENIVVIKPAMLYILSGVENSGKNTLIRNNNVDEELVIDLEKIKGTFLGKQPKINEMGDISYNNYQLENELAKDIMKNIAVMRMKQGLTTILVAPFNNDEEREEFVNLARKFNTRTEILIMNTEREQILEQNKSSKFYVKENVILNKISSFQFDSKFIYRNVFKDTLLKFELNSLKDNKIDVVGDIHGFYDEFIELIERKGYFIENETIKHNEDRKILFLGDFLDKGEQSVDMLNLVFNSVTREGHYAIMGNHEYKILHILSEYISTNRINPRNISNSITISDILKKYPINIVRKFCKFLSSLPSFLTYEDYAFVHADINHFDPLKTPKSNLIFGDSKKGDNNDDKYQELYDNGINKYTIFRGHTTGDNKNNNIFTLEDKDNEGGTIKILDFEQFYEEHKSNTLQPFDFFKKHTDTISVNFDNDKKEHYTNKIKKLTQLKDDSDNIYYTNKSSSFIVFEKVCEDSQEFKDKCFDFIGDVIINTNNKDNINISYNPYENNKIVIIQNNQFNNQRINDFIKRMGGTRLSKLTKILKKEARDFSISIKESDGQYEIDEVINNSSGTLKGTEEILKAISDKKIF